LLQADRPANESRSLIADNRRESGIAMAANVGLVDDIAAGCMRMPGMRPGRVDLDILIPSVGKKPRREKQ
jgi:hypothetical protein